MIQNSHRLFGIEYAENIGKASQTSQIFTYLTADINIYAMAPCCCQWLQCAEALVPGNTVNDC
jgi:hypothetical protein